MKITYTATNRAHHYPYAKQLMANGALQAFISGFSRLSPRSPLPEIGKKLVRCDLYQTAYLASIKAQLPILFQNKFNRASNEALDRTSYKYAKASDIFLYYRTTGIKTARRLKSENSHVKCVLEEVNSHVDTCSEILREEFARLGISDKYPSFADRDRRVIGYEEADYILCPSDWVKQSFVARGFPVEKILKNPYGFNLNHATSELLPNSSDGIFRVLFVGQIHYRKGLRYLINAFNELNHPKKELLIVGPKTNIDGLNGVNIGNDVKFLGVLKGDELNAAYRSSSVFCLPTLEEGMALVVGEAISFGLPVITTERSGAGEIITNNVEGWFVAPGNSKLIKEKLEQLADSPETLSEMRLNALNRAKLLGGWEASGKQLINNLENILNK